MLWFSLYKLLLFYPSIYLCKQNIVNTVIILFLFNSLPSSPEKTSNPKSRIQNLPPCGRLLLAYLNYRATNLGGGRGRKEAQKKKSTFPSIPAFSSIAWRGIEIEGSLFLLLLLFCCCFSYISPLSSLYHPKGVFQKRKNDCWWY